MRKIAQHFFNASSADEIIPKLWVGDVESSQDIEFLTKNNIQVVINCTKDLPFTEHPIVKYRYRLPVDDNLREAEFNNMANFIGEIVKIINGYYQKGYRILIHCYAGIQRSAFVFLIYHVQFHSRDYQKTLKLLKSKRPIVFTPIINFSPVIKRYFTYSSSK